MSVLTTIYHLATDESQEVLFKPITSVDKQYIGQAMGMASLLTQAVKTRTIAGKVVPYWDIDEGIKIVKDHSEMAIISILRTTVTQQDANASLMAKNIFDAIKAGVQAYFQQSDMTQMINSIESAFSNLATQKGDAWIFWQKEEEHKTTYEYNLLYAVQNQATGALMLAMPLVLYITVDVSKEKVLFITVEDKHNYSTEINALVIAEALK